MEADLRQLTLSGQTDSLLPPHAQPNLLAPRAQPHLNSPTHMRPPPANRHARQHPIPIGPYKRLSPRGCIGNAPAIRLISTSTLLRRRTPDTTHMTSDTTHMTSRQQSATRSR